MVTRTYPLGDLGKAFDDMLNGLSLLAGRTAWDIVSP